MKDIRIFLLSCFVISYLIDIIIYFNGGIKTLLAFIMLLIRMFIPSITAYLTIRRIIKGNPIEYGIQSRIKLRYYIYALIYPFIIIGIGLIILYFSGFTHITFDTNEMVKNLIRIQSAKSNDILSNISTDTLIQLKNIIIIVLIPLLVIAPFINSIPAFGEEYGWRGYLLDRMITRYGYLKAPIIVGFIWGLWHIPLILMGYNYPHHPNIIGIATFTILTILMGIYLGWLRIASESVFTSALCHGSINAYLSLGLLVAYNPDELYTIPLGIPAIPAYIFTALPALLILKKYDQKYKNNPKNLKTAQK